MSSSEGSETLSPLFNSLLALGPSHIDLEAEDPLAFYREPATQLSSEPEVDTIAHYPVAIQERLRKRHALLLTRGVLPTDIDARIAQMAASIGTDVSPSSEVERRAVQSLRAQEAYSATEPNFSDDLAVINFITIHGPSAALAIAKGILGETAIKSQVNPLLHRMKQLGVLRQSNSKLWSLAEDSLSMRISYLMRTSPPRNALEIAGLLGVRHSDIATVLSEMSLTCLSTTVHNTPAGPQTYYRYSHNNLFA